VPVSDLDAVVVGSGPNGLVAACTLAGEGLKVLVLEAEDQPGGGSRSEELTLPGFVHDPCSTVHALGLASKAMRALPLEEHGVVWVHPELPLAQPLDGGSSVPLHRSVDDTAAGLGDDARAYRRLMGPLVDAGLDLFDSLLSPFEVPPKHPIALARYGIRGIRSANGLVRRFGGERARALIGGLAGHSILSFSALVSGGYALALGSSAHVVGYPVAQGGSQAVVDALISILRARGGELETGVKVTSLAELPPAKAVLLDVAARHAVSIAGDRFPPRYQRALTRFRYGPGVHKVDWALDGPVPWADPEVARAGTVHLGGTYEEMAAGEDDVLQGRHPERPYVLFVQATQFDPTRAPEGKHTAWGYCHVPNGSTVDMTERIEAQVERFAPGFRDRVIGRHVRGALEVEARDANYVGGDINAGAADLRQFVRRPTLGLDPWRTPADGVYLCSSSTPPGGGVHGMCGWNAARSALKHTF
jgi:phytoene dehydrogenase-like protein